MGSEDLEDTLLRRVLAVSLRQDRLNQDVRAPVLFLGSLSQEIEMESMGNNVSPLMNKNNLDRILVARLIETPPPSYPQTPVQYLLGSFARSLDEARSPAIAGNAHLMETLRCCRDLIVNYAALTLSGMGIVPHTDKQSEDAEKRGSLQLLDSLMERICPGSSGVNNVVPMPMGFMEDLASKHLADGNEDGLQELMRPIAIELARRVKRSSALGDFATPLACVRIITAIEPIARVLVSSREWLPNLKDVTGRGIEAPGSSWMGPCFCPSAIDDPLVRSTPSVLEQCFEDPDKRRPGDMQQSMRTLQLSVHQVQTELFAIVKQLLGKGTRDAMITWLAAVMEGNMERAKMQVNPEKAASHGFFINFSAVMLKLAAPFSDPTSANFWKRVDVRYPAHNPRLCFAEDTKLSASLQEDAAWRARIASSASASSSNGEGRDEGAGPSSTGPIEYHFICECFFMTLKSLHLGLAKVVDDYVHMNQRLGYLQGDVQELETQAASLQGTPQGMAAQFQLTQMKKLHVRLKGLVLALGSVIQDESFMGEVLAFYRLVAAWLLSIADPQCGGNPNAVSLPLRDPAPTEFTTLPEWFVEDIVDLLNVVSRAYPPVLMNAQMDEIMMMLLAFMGSPQYVRSSHIRAKMAELLHLWLPQEDPAPGPGRMRRFNPRGQLSSSLAYLFQGHPMVLQHLAPALIRLYVDVEVMDTRNQFYEKFHFRMYIGEILAHLWEQPAHRQAWLTFSEQQGTETKAYVRFANMLITDATYLLDECLKKLESIKAKEVLMANQAAWEALPQQERQEAQSVIATSGSHLRGLLMYAQVTINVMNFSTEQVCGTFLLPEMVERTAATLDYFLMYLTGPLRRKLAIKESEKYNFRPRELLLNIIQIYLHLFAADSRRLFARAIASDGRSYNPNMFPEAARVLAAAQMLGPGDMAQLEVLARAVAEARASVEEQEDLLVDEEIPEDFQDPVMATLMEDPVKLPTSGYVMDRAHITRHLLTDQRDPMNRKPLTPEMLQPQPELRQRIQTWVSEVIAAKRQGGPKES